MCLAVPKWTSFLSNYLNLNSPQTRLFAVTSTNVQSLTKPITVPNSKHRLGTRHLHSAHHSTYQALYNRERSIPHRLLSIASLYNGLPSTRLHHKRHLRSPLHHPRRRPSEIILRATTRALDFGNRAGTSPTSSSISSFFQVLNPQSPFLPYFEYT